MPPQRVHDLAGLGEVLRRRLRVDGEIRLVHHEEPDEFQASDNTDAGLEQLGHRRPALPVRLSGKVRPSSAGWARYSRSRRANSPAGNCSALIASAFFWSNLAGLALT